jgi:hypothetical protein
VLNDRWITFHQSLSIFPLRAMPIGMIIAYHHSPAPLLDFLQGYPIWPVAETPGSDRHFLIQINAGRSNRQLLSPRRRNLMRRRKAAVVDDFDST